ncbi:hypothetical protein PPH41_42305 [Burkholderia gladioli]|nr:hypothetical protein [Burkholderia gladioli]
MKFLPGGAQEDPAVAALEQRRAEVVLVRRGSVRLPEAIAVHRRYGLIERPELARFVEWLREELAGPD